MAERTNIPVGENLKLHCKATGNVPLTYTWLHNGHRLSAPGKHQGPDLTIEDVSEDNEGKYICTVANQVGKKLRSSTVMIKVGEPAFEL